MPSIVTRPVMASMAGAIRLNWRMVVIVTSGWRHRNSGRIAMAFVVLRCVGLVSSQRYYKSRFRSSLFWRRYCIRDKRRKMVHQKQPDYQAESITRDFAATTFVVHEQRTLLLYHRK